MCGEFSYILFDFYCEINACFVINHRYPFVTLSSTTL